MTSSVSRYKSDFARRFMAVGKVEDLLMVLEARGIEVTDAARQRITECTDPEQLDRWTLRALTVTSVEEVFADR
ncbi:hypothetical protein [Thermomonospora cellulosilytica]|uniref:Uncharacterized protein n=1 Tax=Thermomonospora cellulosilytica TaxID=1411118 RepID=A0A7W3R670_9ACTN|nr:hypothetical protein [Thermomonospora cellulosilytica]MBA9001201.1 hypothetical protein [Thermomonospora cellulosilytica]